MRNFTLYDTVPEYTEAEAKTVEAYNLVMMYLDQVRNWVNEWEGKVGSDIYTSYEWALTRYLLESPSARRKIKISCRYDIDKLFDGGIFKWEKESLTNKTWLEKIKEGVKFKKVFFNRIIKRLEIQENYIPDNECQKIENFIDDCLIVWENGEHYRSDPLDYVNEQYLKAQKQYLKKQAGIIGELEIRYKWQEGNLSYKKRLHTIREKVKQYSM